MNPLPSMALAVVLFACGFTIPAGVEAAGRVFLNGVEITGVKDQTFEGSTVRIDRNGDIFIVAPQYSVKEETPPPKPPLPKPDSGGPNTALSSRYYLVTQPSNGAPQCELTISVNGEAKRTVKPAVGPQLILEISAWLHAGDNEFHVTGPWCNGQHLPGAAPAKLLLGRGHEENKVVKIDEILLSVSVSASTTWPVSERRLFLAQ